MPSKKRLPRLFLLLGLVTLTGGPIGKSVAEEAVARSVPDGIQIWTVAFVDAKTRKSLPGIVVDASVRVEGEAQAKNQTFTSDQLGRIKLPLRKGQCTFLNVRGPGWCLASGIPLVGEVPADWKKTLKGRRKPEADPNKVKKIKLYRGTEVRGRLLFPDGTPAAGVSLVAGVNCNQQPWISAEYLEFLMSVSFSTSEWPNWRTTTTTESDGTFNITVPPPHVRGWVRVGTIEGGYTAIDTAAIEKNAPEHALVRFAPFQVEINGHESRIKVDESSGVMDIGDLSLSRGIVVRGRVLDAGGKPLSGIVLFTSSERGPYAGRKTVSGADGAFAFMPMNPGTFRLSPDAHFLDEKGEKHSRDVQAVFVPREVTLSEERNPLELVVQALPHVALEFEWIDRRAKKGPVSYYGGFSLTGSVPNADGSKPSYWRGETEKVIRGDKEFLIVKVPKNIVELTMELHPDERVTPSYSDDVVKGATGQVRLTEIERPQRRVIVGDEPLGR
jgi:hypothetical protein